MEQLLFFVLFLSQTYNNAKKRIVPFFFGRFALLPVLSNRGGASVFPAHAAAYIIPHA
jgi:hypothetical protein